MKSVLNIKTPIGGVIQIIPQDGAQVGLTYHERDLTELQKEASRQYLFAEGFMEAAAGMIENDPSFDQLLTEPESAEN